MSGTTTASRRGNCHRARRRRWDQPPHPVVAPRPDAADHDPAHDFDFYFGSWRRPPPPARRAARRERHLARVREHVHRPAARWAALGNIDDNVLDHPNGTYRAISIRAYDPESRQWAIWWLDGRNLHHIDPPVIGGFEDGIGTFIGEDTFKGIPILVRFRWSDITDTTCRWEQAFSIDHGETWEVNWVMESTRSRSARCRGRRSLGSVAAGAKAPKTAAPLSSFRRSSSESGSGRRAATTRSTHGPQRNVRWPFASVTSRRPG